MRVITYIDGFNLYFGLRSRYGGKYKWLDVYRLSHNLLKTNQTLIEVKYFTARINGEDREKIKRQTEYLEALQTGSALLIFGKYLKKKKRCGKCREKYYDYEEKGTDVNIAAELMSDAFEDRADVFLIISGDSDLIRPLKKVRDRFPDKKVVVVFPPDRVSKEIRHNMNDTFTLGEGNLRNSLLPEKVVKGNYTIYRPPTWR